MSTPRFGRLIRKRRLARGMTQADVAERIGISRTQYVNLESGRFRPSVESAVLASKVLRISDAAVFRALRLDILEE